MEGGGNQSHIKPALAPTRPHPFHRQKNPKSLWFGWEREGGRGGGAILIIIRPWWLRGQAHLASDPFFGGGGKGPKFRRLFSENFYRLCHFQFLGCKTEEILPVCNIFERLVDFPILGGNNEFFLDKFPPIIFRELVQALLFSKFGCKTETILSVLPYVFFKAFGIFNDSASKISLDKIPPIISRELVRALWFQNFWVQNRGKCCPFFTHFFSGFLIFWFGAPRRTKFRQLFPQNLWRLFDFHVFDAEQREMLPVFHPICFWGVLTFRLRSKNITGQNSANYLQRTFEGFVIWNCGWKKGGNAARFSPNFFSGFLIFWFGAPRRRKFRQLFPQNLWRLFDSHFFDAKEGEMLPVFHPICFWGVLTFRLRSKYTTGQNSPIICRELLKALWFEIVGEKRGGKCCPFFTQTFLRHFKFPILGSKEDKIQPIISRELVKALGFWIFECKTGGNAARFSPNSVLRFFILGSKNTTGRNSANYLQRTCEGFVFSDFLGTKQGEMLPVFHPIFSRAFWFSDFGLQGEQNSAKQFPQSLWRLCDSDFFDAKEGEMLPVFHPICFWGVLTFRLRSKNITGQNSANYLQRTFEGFVIWNCGWKKGGKCCPFFTQTFFEAFPVSDFGLQGG